MRIDVCVKQTPDSSSVYVDPISGQVDYERFVQILNPADACAVEAAVRIKEMLGGTVLALTLGPEDAEGALRAALAIGADTAIRLWHPQAGEWGAFTVAAALAAYIKQEASLPDLVLCGDASSDWASGTVGPALAEMLDLPQITGVVQLNVVGVEGPLAGTRSDEATTSQHVTLKVTRRLERGYRELLEAEPPLFITVTSDLNEPRYPSLPAHIAALRAKIPCFDPLASFGENLHDELDETTLIEMHIPRPRPRRIAAPNSHHSAFERIGEIVSGGAIGRQTRLVEGTSEELAKVLVEFLKDKGFVE
jgi:electron transfer flavoprotein beta subunit